MTEPVAYLNSYKDKSTNITKFKPIDNTALVSSNKLYTADQLHQRVKMTQAEFDELEKSLINAQFDYSELKKTIEIVPNMKWFVRSKEQYQPDMDQGISESGYLYLTQGDIYSVEYHEMTTFKDEATQFNTEDEAKLWTTPDTEAVQLPVEGE